MFTRDRLPEYFIGEEEPRFHRMAPNLVPNDTGISFFDEDPRLNPHYWVRDWYVAEEEDQFKPKQPEHTKNYFLLHPAPKGYAVRMWFNLFQSRDWRYIWYWRAVVWYDLSKMIEGKWWMAAGWLKYNQANTYHRLFENENDSVIAGAYMAGLDCSVKNMGK